MSFIKKFLIFIGFVTMLALLALASFTAYQQFSKKIQPHSVLMLDFQNGLASKHQDENILSIFQGQNSTLEDYIHYIDRAKTDPNIDAIVMNLNTVALSLTDTEELREVLKTFQRAGKPVYAYADTFGEFTNGTLAYYLASVCDQVWVQPVGEVNITGMHAELPFLATLLEQLDVEPLFDRRKEYKTFSEMFTKDSFTPANHESTLQLLESLFQTITEDIVSDREISLDELKTLIDNSPFLTAEDAKKAGLIDQVGYIDDFKNYITKHHPQIKKTLSITQYKDASDEDEMTNQPHIAMIYGVGSIQRGDHGENMLSSQAVMGSQETRKAFESAMKNPFVKAIILRMDCPGGSAIASETVRHSIEQARAKGIPVVLSIGEVAASGGYWMGCSANQIVANKTSITGSIGVTGGKFNLKKFFEMIGVNWEAVSIGENASMWSMLSPYTEKNHEHLQRWLDQLYDRFIILVSKKRKLPIEHVEEIARGRVWTGVEAKKFGLVDHMGGIQKSIAIASELTKSSTTLPVVHYPKAKSPLEKLMIKDSTLTLSMVLHPLINAFRHSMLSLLSIHASPLMMESNTKIS